MSLSCVLKATLHKEHDCIGVTLFCLKSFTHTCFKVELQDIVSTVVVDQGCAQIRVVWMRPVLAELAKSRMAPSSMEAAKVAIAT